MVRLCVDRLAKQGCAAKWCDFKKLIRQHCGDFLTRLTSLPSNIFHSRGFPSQPMPSPTQSPEQAGAATLPHRAIDRGTFRFLFFFFHSAHTVTVKVVSRIVLTRLDSFLAKGLFYSCNLISGIRFKTK